jgi:hypothetical protein
LVSAEHNVDGFVFFGEFHKAAIVIDVYLQRIEIPVSQLTHFYSPHHGSLQARERLMRLQPFIFIMQKNYVDTYA